MSDSTSLTSTGPVTFSGTMREHDPGHSQCFGTGLRIPAAPARTDRERICASWPSSAMEQSSSEEDVITVGSAPQMTCRRCPMVQAFSTRLARFVLPGFVDSHTHLIFAGSREDEFEARLARSVVSADRSQRRPASMRPCGEFREASAPAACRTGPQTPRALFSGFGVTTVEVKSGYGV